MRRSTFALSAAALLATTVCTTVPAQATGPHTPNSITTLTARPGPEVGEATLDWTEDGTYTTGYLLETGLNSFSKTNSTMPVSGRHATFFGIPPTARTLTLTAAQMAQAGAPVASGNHLYFRLAALNQDASGVTATRYYPYLQAVLPRPQAPAATGTNIRIASFHVRTARATTDTRTWLQRAPDVAKQIVAYHPGLVALQELGPRRADGQPGSLQGTPPPNRQPVDGAGLGQR